MAAVFEELMKGYTDLRRVLRRTFSADDAADIAQSSFEQAWRYAQKNDVLSPASLLFSISRHLQIDAARRRKRVSEDLVSDDVQLDQLAVCEVTPERQQAGRQTVNLLNQTLDNLAPRCREAFVLCKIHGLSYEEAAQEMGISPNVIRKYLVQALKECRKVVL
jgi:RNA polymerase sigma-70 factor (ECF subfamily)